MSEKSTSTSPTPFPRSAPVRPPRHWASRYVHGFRLWARETFAPEQLISGVKSLLWVAPLTVAIWIYAEREQTVTATGYQFTVQAHSADPAQVVEIREPAGGKVRADLSGPHRSFELLREQLDAGATPQIEVDPHLGPGHHLLPTALVGGDPLFRNSGVTLSNYVPPELDVFVDPIEDISLDVQVAPGVTNLDGPAVFEPRTVHVRCPQSVRESAQQGGKLAAYADLAAFPQTREPGPHEIPAVPVKLQFTGAHLTMTPATVSAKFSVRKADATVQIPSMPVWAISAPGPFQDKYKAEYTPSLVNVTVIGPEATIRAMQDPSFEPKPKAMFEISDADLPVGISRERLVKYDLPPGVHVSSEDAKRTISFKLADRTQE